MDEAPPEARVTKWHRKAEIEFVNMDFTAQKWGADADLVLLDPDDLTVRACFVRGRLAYSHPSLRGALWFHS